MRIIIDVMSGDNAPSELIKGAILAKQEFPVDITIVGDETVIEDVVERDELDISSINIVHADDVIEMEDKPLCVVREKSGSSMSVGLRMLSNGEGDAFVSAGNTGALLAGATLIVRRIKGIQRAAIATVLPLEKPLLLIDSGANLVVSEENMEQFAKMGSIYMENIFGIQNPRVGQVNNGTEYNKGLPLQVETYKRLSEIEDINFVGNIEGKQVPFGACDVLITDGFTGNVLLKLVEGMGKFMMKTMKSLFLSSTVSKMAALALRNQVKLLKKKFDASEHGGAPLLGISKPVIKAHGSSDANAVKNAVRQAIEFINTGVNVEIAEYSLEFERKREEARAAEKAAQQAELESKGKELAEKTAQAVEGAGRGSATPSKCCEEITKGDTEKEPEGTDESESKPKSRAKKKKTDNE